MTEIVIINPGTGPVADAKLADATSCMKAFAADLAARLGKTVTFSRTRGDEDVRYAFVVACDKREVSVDMPGLPVDRVRYQDGMNPWHFPRLYVDGNSWLWEFAVNIAEGTLSGRDE